ncbi:MAG TPA: hypothetical protein VLJ61_12745 [Pyrinomonadaceae bacterium]|nr:hypothetical protein [Pyrinomonadaceae bacterium]
MLCAKCNSILRRYGKTPDGLQKYKCAYCLKYFQESRNKLFDSMHLSDKKCVQVLHSLIEGMSVRSTERITGIHRDTILDILVFAGNKCEKLLEEKLQAIPVSDVQADEMWGFVYCKEKRKRIFYPNNEAVGHAWTYVAIERNSRLVLAWHLGKRSAEDTSIFAAKLRRATSGHFQLSTDGFKSYPDSIRAHFGNSIDFGQLVKTFSRGANPILKITKTPQIGTPFLKRISTSHVERHNLTMRMSIRRLTRLTNAYSKKWENLRAALAFYFAYYNFCRIHSTIRCTPAMASSITNSSWPIEKLLC